MKRISNPIIEQCRGDKYYHLAVPKKYMEEEGVKQGDSLYFSVYRHKPLVLKYSQTNTLGLSIKRKITGSAGFCKISIPPTKDKHGKGSRWDCYTKDGDLYYILIPEFKGL